MKQSIRAKRLARHHKRLGNSSKLNLVSLMDIFTILVFFLIVNQSEVRVLQNAEQLNLPVSVADELPSENLVISVFSHTVLVQDRAIWQQELSNKPVSQVVSQAKSVLSEQNIAELISALKTELAYQTTKRPELTELEQKNGRAVTILGDATIEYKLLKQIMTVCAENNYRNLSLAVERVVSKPQGNS